MIFRLTLFPFFILIFLELLGLFRTILNNDHPCHIYYVQYACAHFFYLCSFAWIIFFQVWCILLNDKVPFRMHWPLHSDMQINGIWLYAYSLIVFCRKLFIELHISCSSSTGLVFYASCFSQCVHGKYIS